MRNPGFLISAVLMVLLSAPTMAQTAITYQGQLQDSNGPFDGTPGMEFRLYDSLEGGNQVGSTIILSAVDVSDGLFQVELDFGDVFDSSPLYLEVEVAGNILTPRQPVTAVPTAISALNLSSAGLAELDDRYWKQGGNAGTNPAQDFIGTSDDAALLFQVNDTRALRIEPAEGQDGPLTGFIVPNLIGGHHSNSVATGVAGATIGGGGFDDGAGNALPNQVEESFGTIGGGAGNEAHVAAAVGGGERNSATGQHAMIGGGFDNRASGDFSMIGGGSNNVVSGDRATIGGGNNNVASSLYATVSGGIFNSAEGDRATVGGGQSNEASGRSATISGGDGNTASELATTVGGGEDNTAESTGATVPGGILNEASGFYAFAAGRQAKAKHSGTFVWADFSGFGTDFESTASNQFLIRAAGNVGINTNAPTHTLSVDGDASKPGGGDWATFSDARLKREIEPLAHDGSVLERLLELEGYEFEYSESAIEKSLGLPGRQIGLIAQEVRKIFPGWVSSTDDGHLYVTERGTTALFVEALRELRAEKDAEIASLHAEVSALERRADQVQALSERNAELEARLAALEAMLLEDRRVTEGR